MSLLPIYIYEPDTELPDEGNYFVVANNGVFMHKDLKVTKSLVKVDLDKVPCLKDFVAPKPPPVPIYMLEDDCDTLPDDQGNYFLVAKNGIYEHNPQARKFARADLRDIPGLGELHTKIRFMLPKIPLPIIARSLMFFQCVYDKHHAEAELVLYYNFDKKEYFLRCPKQRVSAGGVHYGNETDENDFIGYMRTIGYMRVGTLHSHCSGFAFHSGTDTNDEATWPDGVHITLGHVNCRQFSLVSSLVANNNRIQVDPPSIIDGVEKKQQMGFQTAAFFELLLTETQRQDMLSLHKEEIEADWMPQVKTYSYYCGSHKKKKGYESSGWTSGLFSWQSGLEGGDATMDVATSAEPAENPSHVMAWSFLRKVRNHARLLQKDQNILLPGMLEELHATLRHFFRKDVITDEDIATAVALDPKNVAWCEEKGYAIQ